MARGRSTTRAKKRGSSSSRSNGTARRRRASTPTRAVDDSDSESDNGNKATAATTTTTTTLRVAQSTHVGSGDAAALAQQAINGCKATATTSAGAVLPFPSPGGLGSMPTFIFLGLLLMSTIGAVVAGHADARRPDR